MRGVHRDPRRHRGIDAGHRRHGSIAVFLTMRSIMAGLDTVSVTLGWMLLHLTRNDADRERIVAEPAIVPTAVEEFVRVYAIVIPARKVMADIEIQGRAMKGATW
jgi:cytochrome P450